MTDVEEYLYEKLIHNRIILDQYQIETVVRIYTNKDGYKQYIDKFIKILIENKNNNLREGE